MSEANASVELRLQGTLADLDRVHQALSDLQAQHQIPEPPLTAVRLALDELVTNVIVHGFSQTNGVRLADPHLAVRLHCSPESLEASVEDNAPPFDPTVRPPVDTAQSLQHREIGGLGLYLVRQSVDTIRYERSGDRNRVTIGKQLAKPKG